MPIPSPMRTPDISRKVADTIALHQTVLSKDELIAGRYIAVALADGSTDGVAYESRAAAALYQRHNASRCMYLRVPLERMNAETVDTLLWYTRAAYDAGTRQDPAHQLIVSNQREHLIT